MRAEPKTKVCGAKPGYPGHSYQVMMLNASQSCDMLVDLAKMLGPAITDVFNNDALLDQELIDIAAEVQKAGLATVMKGLRTLVSTVDKPTFKRIRDGFAANTLVDGKPLANVFDLHFTGAQVELFEWLAFAIEVNYEDFFGMLASAMPPAKPEERSEKEAPALKAVKKN